MKLHFDNDWLRRKIENQVDDVAPLVGPFYEAPRVLIWFSLFMLLIGFVGVAIAIKRRSLDWLFVSIFPIGGGLSGLSTLYFIFSRA